jgi:hypothetical protein
MKPDTGRFSEDTYARARAFLDKQQSRPEADTPKPAAKRAAPAAPKRDMSTVGPRRSMAPAAKGSGRGGQGGPTADELDAYKSKRDKAFSDSVNKYVGEQSAADRRREMIGVANGIAGATGVGLGVRALGLMGKGARAAASTDAGKKALGALKDMTSGGPRVAKTTMPARPTAKTGPKQGTSDAVRRSEEGFSPAEANKALARATKSAPAKKAAPASKPTITAAAKPKAPRKTATTTTRKFNDEEKGVEFKRGGKVKRKGY